MALRKAVGGMVGLAIAMGVGRFAFTPILPAMQAGTGLGDDGAGLIAALNFAGYFAGALLAARVPRGTPRTVTFRACLLLSLATTAGMAAGGFWAWAALRLVAGAASAGMLVLGSAMVLDGLAEEGRAELAGLTFGGVGLGIAASGTAIALMGAGWRQDWLVLAAACAVLAIPVWLWVTDPAASARPRPSPPPPSTPLAPAAGTTPLAPAAGTTPLAPAAGTTPLVLLALAYFCEGAGYIVTGTFLVSMLARAPATAGVAEAAWIVAGVAGAVSVVAWNLAGRRIGLRGALAAAHLVQAAAILAPVLSTSPLAALLGAVGFGGTFMGITALTLALGRELSPGASGPAIALLTAAFALGQMLGPFPAGVMLEHTGGFHLPLSAAAALVAFGALLVVLPAARPGGAGRAAGLPGPHGRR